jgi:hypothetical protein
MVSSAYLSGRKKYTRPQAIIFSNNPGVFNALTGDRTIDGVEGEDFIVLSDHNRSDISFKTNRLENRKRMVNGHMRSYHIADKMNLSFSYNLLPSRSFSGDQSFSASGQYLNNLIEYTVDGGAGGAELLEWYDTNPGSFYVFISYDKPQSFSVDPENPQEYYNKLDKYSDELEVFFSDFSYNVIKRGGANHDLWDISISLEEV